jgi:CBS domain-containing protein
MALVVADIMTRDPATIECTASAAEAARRMAATDAGAIIVLDNGKVCGIVTDRDIAIRLVAEDKESGTPVAEIVSDQDLHAVTPDTPIDRAIEMIRRQAVRRLPVIEAGKAVGIMSLGDLAIERDPRSALADISAAEGNA